MDNDFTNADTLIAKALDLQERAQANPGNPTIAQEIQDFSLAIALAWKPQFDRLFAIIEGQHDTIQQQAVLVESLTTHLIDMTERVGSLCACLQRFQAFRIPTNEALSLVPRTGEATP